MEKKSFFQRLWAFMNDPRLEKPLMIAAPCLALVLAGMILLPHLRALGTRVQEELPSPEATQQAVEIALPAASPSPSAEPTPEPTE